MSSDHLAELAEALRKLLAVLPEKPSDAMIDAIVVSRRNRLRDEIHEAIRRLTELADRLDPVRQPSVSFDPSHPETIGRFIASTLLEQPRQPLATLPRFYGSGVYGIYSRSDFRAYAPIRNTETPIYVGKADPKSIDAATPREQGDKLWARLVTDHAKNIKAATNLKIEDFDCRFLVVRSAWQKTAEDYLISRFKPIWNSETRICFGFGKHGDRPEKRSNTRSPWDTLHPGRKWAASDGNSPNPLSPDEIIEQILQHYRANPPEK